MLIRIVAILLALIQPAAFPVWCWCAIPCSAGQVAAEGCFAKEPGDREHTCSADRSEAATDCCCNPLPEEPPLTPAEHWPSKPGSPVEMLELTLLPGHWHPVERVLPPRAQEPVLSGPCPSHQFDRSRQSLLCVRTT